MLSLGPATKVYLAAGATDLRAGFERLSVLVQAVLEQNALSGHLFVFCNATRTRIKILYWDGTGLWILAKRLERGRFCRPACLTDGGNKIALKPEALEMLLSGIDLKHGMQRAWYELPEK